MEKMKVLVIGGGGREDAIVRQCLQSAKYEVEMFVAPGNGGTAQRATNVPIRADNIPALLAFARDKAIGLTVVGPEQPLKDGIVDKFREAGLRIFGPTKAAARLECSKVYAKRFMTTCGIPTARHCVAFRYETTSEKLRWLGMPVVIKADGLAAGKGVAICHTMEEADNALRRMMTDRQFGSAGQHVVIERMLTGREISVLTLCDGISYRLLLSSQDHKQVGDGDTGPNTGGMGAIAPVPWVSQAMLDTIDESIIRPTLRALFSLHHKFTGCLYAGLMITDDGPVVLEFNVRFGDPEIQAILPLMKSDFLAYLLACTNGTLENLPPIEWHDRSAACVVLTSGGYPGDYKTGYPISGLDVLNMAYGDVHVFHAGTQPGDVPGQVVTSSGRVLDITRTAPTLDAAIAGAYEACRVVRFNGCYFRPDIGAKALAKVSA